MTADPAITAETFERQYAERSRLTVERLRELGRVVVRCRCGDQGCPGWASVSKENAAEYLPGAIYGPTVTRKEGVMNAADALNAALRALDEIDKIAEGPISGGDAAQDALDDIHDITGNVIGDLARAGYENTNKRSADA